MFHIQRLQRQGKCCASILQCSERDARRSDAMQFAMLAMLASSTAGNFKKTPIKVVRIDDDDVTMVPEGDDSDDVTCDVSELDPHTTSLASWVEFVVG